MRKKVVFGSLFVAVVGFVAFQIWSGATKKELRSVQLEIEDLQHQLEASKRGLEAVHEALRIARESDAVAERANNEALRAHFIKEQREATETLENTRERIAVLERRLSALRARHEELSSQ